MKATIFAIMFTFSAAGVMIPEADARPNRRSYKKGPNSRHRVRTRTPRVVRKRQSVRRVRQPTRNYRQPTRSHYRQPARTHYRKPVRTHYRRPVRRYYRPALRTITLSNSHGFAIRVAVRAGNSSVCAQNPLQGRQFLAAGTSLSVSTRGSYVCYRQLPTRVSTGSGWYRAVVSAQFTQLWF